MISLFRVFIGLVSLLATVINTLLNWLVPSQRPKYPPIRNRLLTKSIHELILELRQKKLTSVELVKAYIKRQQEVNPTLNAIVEERYEAALKDATHADHLVAKCSNEQQLGALFAIYPLLGLPFTVKEACGVQDMSFVVGSMQRLLQKAPKNGDVVEHLRAAGCIPLVVSANPEFCMAFETNTHTHGRCRNPYDLRRSPAGSSGGEGALNGCGATLFGVGSDIGGSVRIPAMFCGVYGHKPTGGLLSIGGHFPNSTTDEHFPHLMQLGPITRFARDLPVLLQIMAGKNAEKLKLADEVPTKDLKIYYAFGFDGPCRWMYPHVSVDIKLSITRAVKCFEKGGLQIQEIKIENMKHPLEMVTSYLGNVKGIPSVITHSVQNRPKTSVLFLEVVRSVIGHSLFTKDAVLLEYLQSLTTHVPEQALEEWRQETELLKTELINLLGDRGVLFFPTFHTSALFANMAILNMPGLATTAVFNILGFPATHVPLGVDRRGFPVGFQVIAAPFQDKLCLQIAAELEATFGGWEPPQKHEIRN